MIRKRVMVGDGVIDLSLVDNAGRYRGYRTTANCYLVHKAGKYKIPLVYGNAIKDGQVNTVAFSPGGTTTDTYLANFYNANNGFILAPWVNSDPNDYYYADLLWQDATGMIDDVSIKGNYLYFTVGEFIRGNALISVKGGDDDVRWSWHIWCTDDTLENTTSVSTGSHDYDVAPVNLGWIPTNSSGKQGYCTYYQWGRPTPFIPAAAYNSTTNHTVYGINGSTTTGIIFDNTGPVLTDALKYPREFYSNGSNWYNKSYDNLWDAQQTGKQNITTATIKTVYDPCPPDFCVPTGNLIYFIGNGNTRTMSTWDSTNNGATWNTGITGNALWFPASGSRTSSTAKLGSVGSYIRFVSASSGNLDTNAKYISANSSSWSYTNVFRAGGTAIRPVKEE